MVDRVCPPDVMPAVPLQRREGATHLDLGLETARDLLERRVPDDALPVTLAPLQRLLPHGLLRGELIEIHGGPSCGRLSTVLALLASTTAAGETAALADLGDHFDPQDAIAAGVELERLLWMRPRDLKQTLHAAETAITGGFPLVVCDLGAPPIRGGRGAQTAWLRLLAAARAHRATVLVSTPYRASGSAATVVLEARRQRTGWRGERPSHRLFESLGARVTLKKMRGGSLEAAADLLLRRGALAIDGAGVETDPTPARGREPRTLSAVAQQLTGATRLRAPSPRSQAPVPVHTRSRSRG